MMRIEIMIDKEQKVSQATIEALESEIIKNLRPQYPKMAIRIRKGSANGIELSGLRQEDDKKKCNGYFAGCVGRRQLATLKPR